MEYLWYGHLAETGLRYLPIVIQLYHLTIEQECVVCGNRYITESDATAARLSTVKPPTPAPVKESESHSISTKQGNYGLHPGVSGPFR
jgi:hypothetical protein